MQFANSRRGLTAVELLIALTVLFVVSTITISALFHALDRSRQRATMADMKLISRVIEAYVVDHERIPGDEFGVDGLRAITTPYTSRLFPVNDHWGHLYRYRGDGVANYTIESFGKDGLDGADYASNAGLDFDRDLVLYNGIFVAAPQ